MERNIYRLIASLMQYAQTNGLANPADRTYYLNCLLDILELDAWDEQPPIKAMSLQSILDELCNYAVEHEIIEEGIASRDLFDTRIMGLFTPLPSVVQQYFWDAYEASPAQSTQYFYRLSRNVNYIRTERVARDLRWKYDGKYGELDITINLSKPEKDPKAIAAALTAKKVAYPKCQLCHENVGYRGRLDHPARQNLRTVPMEIAGERWHLQYSPYVYYNEHCILFNEQHVPMRITHQTFDRLLGFVEKFPHYFIGSNADLPIVGGSILTHDHFQGGNYTFAMQTAGTQKRFSIGGYEDVRVEWLNWPLTVIRLTGTKPRVRELACKVLDTWRGYTDASHNVFAETDGTPHNTITPIARREGERFQLDLVLRNNITTEEHPLGLYHPHAEKHHIKKENIGLIEVMGLAVLPSRLKAELHEIEDRFIAGLPLDTEGTSKHAAWFERICQKRSVTAKNIMAVLQEEVGRVFETVLEDAGVYSPDETGMSGVARFLAAVEKN